MFLILMLLCQCLMAPGRSPAVFSAASVGPSFAAAEDGMSDTVADAEDADGADEQDIAASASFDDAAILHDKLPLVLSHPLYAEFTVLKVPSVHLEVEVPPPELA